MKYNKETGCLPGREIYLLRTTRRCFLSLVKVQQGQEQLMLVIFKAHAYLYRSNPDVLLRLVFVQDIKWKLKKTKQNNNNNNNKQKKKHHGAHIFHLSSHQGFFERSDIRDIQDKVTVIH